MDYQKVAETWQNAEMHASVLHGIVTEKSLVLDGSIVKNSRNRRAMNPGAFYDQYKTRATAAGCPPEALLPYQGFEAWIKYAVPVDIESRQRLEWHPRFPTAESIEDLIANALHYYSIDMGPTGESIRRSGVDIQYDIMEALVKEYCREYEEDSKPKGAKENYRRVYSVARIGDALKLFISNRDIYCRDLLRKSIMYNETAGASNSAWYLIMQIMDIFQVKEDWDLAAIMIMQWMWQTKRYALGMEVLEPLMINFMGVTQGTMKTSFLKALTTPFKQYRKEDAKLAAVLDNREYTLWAKKYVIIFDELSKGRIAANEYGELVTAMKSLLTATSVGGRVMKTTHHIEMQRIFSPISSSNASITGVIRDRTGMRRFFEMNVMTTTRIDPRMVEIVNQLLDVNNGFVHTIWQSVNEHIPQGYLGLENYRTRLHEIQDNYKIVDPTDLWLASEDLQNVPVRYEDMEQETIDYHIGQFTGCQKRTEVEVLNAEIDPYIWIVDYALTKEAHEWVELEMGKSTVNYVGGREHMSQYFRTHGYVVVNLGMETYVLCKGSSMANMETAMGGLQGDNNG